METGRPVWMSLQNFDKRLLNSRYIMKLELTDLVMVGTGVVRKKAKSRVTARVWSYPARKRS